VVLNSFACDMYLFFPLSRPPETLIARPLLSYISVRLFAFTSTSSRFVDTDVWLHDAERYARRVPDLPMTNPVPVADDTDVATTSTGESTAAEPPTPSAPKKAPLRMAASSAAALAPVKPRPYLSPTSSDLGVLTWRKSVYCTTP